MSIKDLAVDVPGAIRSVSILESECKSSHVTPRLAFGFKQDLYIIKFAVDAALANCPSFDGEDKWLKEQEQLRILKILKQ